MSLRKKKAWLGISVCSSEKCVPNGFNDFTRVIRVLLPSLVIHVSSCSPFPFSIGICLLPVEDGWLAQPVSELTVGSGLEHFLLITTS